MNEPRLVLRINISEIGEGMEMDSQLQHNFLIQPLQDELRKMDAGQVKTFRQELRRELNRAIKTASSKAREAGSETRKGRK